MKSLLSQLTAQQLKQAQQIKQKIEALEGELRQILAPGPVTAGPVEKRRRKRMSVAARAKIGAAQKERWAERKKKTAVKPKAPKPVKRKISAAGKARIAAANQARWAKYHAEKKASAVAEK